MEPINLAITLIVAFLTTIFGVIIGGGALVLTPLLIFMGLPPQVAIGTMRFGFVPASLAAKLRQCRTVIR